MLTRIRSLLALIVLLIIFFWTLGNFIGVAGKLYYNLMDPFLAYSSEKKYRSEQDWIKDQFSEEFFDNSWKTFSDFHKIPQDIKRPTVLIYADKSDESSCGPVNGCILGEFSGVSGTVTMYPYRIASVVVYFVSRTHYGFDMKMRIFRAYSEVKLAHEFLHYVHDRQSIPLSNSHLVMAGDWPERRKFIESLATKYGCDPQFLLSDEFNYLMQMARDDLKRIK